MKEFVEVQKGAAKREAAMAQRVNQLAATGATGGDEEYSFLQVDPPYHIDFDGKPGAETGAETGAEVGVAMTGSEEATSPALKWKEQELRALELAHKTEMNRDMDVIEQARNTIERAKRMQTQLVSAANVAAKNVDHDLVSRVTRSTGTDDGGIQFFALHVGLCHHGFPSLGYHHQYVPGWRAHAAGHQTVHIPSFPSSAVRAYGDRQVLGECRSGGSRR